MLPIQAIAGVISKIIQDAMSGAAAQGAQGTQASQGMDLNADDDDDSQTGSAAQASNTLMAGELARIQAMLAQASGAQQNGASGGVQSSGGIGG